jgi:hypothetical protein
LEGRLVTTIRGTPLKRQKIKLIQEGIIKNKPKATRQRINN